MKEQKGITLISLIITIIVMLILVTVSVTVAINGGLFTTAKDAVNNTEIEAGKENQMQSGVFSDGTESGTVNITDPNFVDTL